MFNQIPSKTRLLIKCVNLGKQLDNLRNEINNKITNDETKELISSLKNDGITIFKNIKRLQKNSIESLEYFIAFTWVDTLSEKPLGLSILENPKLSITDISKHVDEIINKTPIQNQYFEALKFIHLKEGLEHYQSIIQGLYFELFNFGTNKS
jgi:hypothetical protein